MKEIFEISFYVVAFIVELFIAGIVLRNKSENKSLCKEVENIKERIKTLENG